MMVSIVDKKVMTYEEASAVHPRLERDKGLGVLPRCVGAIIRDTNGHYLVLSRLLSPLGLAMIAGHIEDGEGSDQALVREVNEESGLEVINFKLVLNRVFPSHGCYRGHVRHEWFVYKVLNWVGIPRNLEPSKHEFVRFMSRKEMLESIGAGLYDPVWFRNILPALKIKLS